MKILTASEMRWVEEEAARFGLTPSVLIDNAGKAVADEIKKILGSASDKRVLFLIGPGNNGADGLVAARYIYNWGARIDIYFFRQRPQDDINLIRARGRPLTTTLVSEDKDLKKLGKLLSSADAVLDAIFGTGMNRPLQGAFADGLEKLTWAKKEKPSLQIISLDIPTGLNADTGACDPACPFADNTITIAFPKPGLFSMPGAERVGKITVVDIGIPSNLAREINRELMEAGDMKLLLPKRSPLANKGTFGRILVVAGSRNYIGAAYLASCAAMRVGAGLVTLATGDSLIPILASKLTEVTYLPLPEVHSGVLSGRAVDIIREEIARYDVLLMGCGLGQDENALSFIKDTLFGLKGTKIPMVLDADALNTLSRLPNWWQDLPDDAILTPHPGEMARLIDLSVDEVQKDRMDITRKMAAKWHKTVVLKGAYTVIAEPKGNLRVSPFANAGLASAGTGDVLAGVIAGLLGQGLPLFDGASAGVYLHGEAGEMVKEKLGDAGMLASDLLPSLPLVIKKLKED